MNIIKFILKLKNLANLVLMEPLYRAWSASKYLIPHKPPPKKCLPKINRLLGEVKKVLKMKNKIPKIINHIFSQRGSNQLKRKLLKMSAGLKM